MIDAHQHIWRLGHNDCTWPTPDLAAIHRDFSIADLKAVASPHRVAGSVLVQSQASDRDTDWLLEVAGDDPFVLGVVGWADFKAPDAPARIRGLAAHTKLVGLRPMLQGMEEDWILDLAAAPAIEAMLAHGLAFDALVFPRHLPALHAFAQRYPGLSIVIDHAAKPLIAEGELDPWRDHMEQLARLPEVTCKLSGLPTEARGLPTEAMAPYVDHLMQIFGPFRMMWGSDWPVVEMDGGYAAWLAAARALVRTTDRLALDAIFGGTARRVYNLQEPA